MVKRAAKKWIACAAAALALALVLLCVFLSGCSKESRKFQINRLEILCDGADTTGVVTKTLGSTDFTLSVRINGEDATDAEKYDAPEVLWKISGNALGCTISDKGVFKLGNALGDVTVQATARSENEMTATLTVRLVSALQGLELTSPPDKTSYIEGERFDRSGIQLTAVFEHYRTEVVDYTVTPSGALSPTDTEVVLTFENAGIRKDLTIAVTVLARTLKSISVAAAPEKTSYIEGQRFDDTGMQIVAHYEYFDLPVTAYLVDKATVLTPDVTEIEVSYTEQGITKTTSVPVSVAHRTLQSISIDAGPDAATYIEGQTFDPAGLRVRAHYEYLSEEAVGFRVDTEKKLTPEDSEIAVSYTENGVTKSVFVNISVRPKTLQSLTLDTANAVTHYIEGQKFDPSGLIVTAHYEYISQIVTDYAVDTSTSLFPEAESWAVSYEKNGVKKSVQLAISVTPKTLQYLSIDDSNAVTHYIEGQAFDKTGLKVTAHYEYITEPAAGFWVDELKKLLPSDTAVTVRFSHNGITRTASVFISVAPKTLQSVTVEHVKAVYIEGQTFDVSGMQVIAHYEYVSKAVSGFTVDTDTVLRPQVREWQVGYAEGGVEKTCKFAISVAPKTLQFIEIVKLPFTTAYLEGQIFHSEGLEIIACYEYIKVPVTGFTVDKEGRELKYYDTAATVQYTERGVTKTAVFELIITDNLLESIRVLQLPDKLAYTEGERLNLVGMVVKGEFTDGTKKIVSGWTVEEAALAIGDTSVTVSYIEYVRGGTVRHTCAFGISVASRELESVTISQLPNKTAYVEGERLDLSGLAVTAVFNNGTETVTDYRVSPAGRALAAGDTAVTVTYAVNGVEKTAGFPISVSPRVLTGLSVDASNIVTDYMAGERLVLTGLIVRAVYNNGLYLREIGSYSVDLLGIALRAEDRAFTVFYEENGVTKSGAVAITVQGRTLQSVEIAKEPDKTAYREGEYFDPAGLSILAKYADSAPAVVYGFRVDQTDALRFGATSVTVRYTESGITKTVEVPITVARALSQRVSAVLEAIGALPDAAGVTEANLAAYQAAAEYARRIYGALTEPEREQITIIGKLAAFEDAIRDFAESLTPVEPSYAIRYELYGELNFDDVDFGANVRHYKNSDGTFALIAPISKMAADAGYTFTRFVDGDTLLTVAKIENIGKDKTYLAVFELTETVTLKFVNFTDRQTELLSPLTVKRRNANGTYLYDLTKNRIADAIFNYTGKVSFAYYAAPYGSERRVFCVADEVDVRLGAKVTVFVVSAALRSITLENRTDASVSWAFAYADDSGETHTVFTKCPPEAEFAVPVGALVTLTAVSPAILDFCLDGVKQNLTYPARSIEFVLLAGSSPMTVTFEKTSGESVTVTFVGVNTVAFVYPHSWNGLIAAADLEKLAFVFDEDNEIYYNVFLIEGRMLNFSELGGFTFSGSTIVTVEKRERNPKTQVELTLRLYDDVIVETSLALGGGGLLSRLPKPEREGYAFLGWAGASEGELFDEAGFEAFIASCGGSADVYAVWEVVSEEKPDYTGQSFIGDWTASANNEFGVLRYELTLAGDGTFTYQTYVNGQLNCGLYGKYAFENGRLTVLKVYTSAEKLLIAPGNFSFDLTYCADNLLIAQAFLIDALTVNTYECVLTRGTVKPSNFSELAGVYTYSQLSEEGAVTVEERTEITVYENGTAAISYASAQNGETVLTQNGFGYIRRNESGEAMFLSNGPFRTLNLDLLLSVSVKDHCAPQVPEGVWTAAESGTMADVRMLSLSGGLLSVHTGERVVTVTIAEAHSGYYAALAQLGGEAVVIQLELTAGGEAFLTVKAVESGAETCYAFYAVA